MGFENLDLKDLLPVIGVIIGFLLATLKEFIQNKPKVKMSLKTGGFKYYLKETDYVGNVRTIPCEPQFADYFSLQLQVDVYNYGKGNTAIKELTIQSKAHKEKRYFHPIMKIKNEENIDYSFNLPSNSIKTIKLELKVDNQEETAVFFSKRLILLPEDKQRLLFTVLIKSINGKKHNLRVEPISILKAED